MAGSRPRIRLVHLNGFGAPSSGTPRAFCIAESPDGVRFTVVQRARWVPVNFTDPSRVPATDLFVFKTTD
jgi:hypothetical protein